MIAVVAVGQMLVVLTRNIDLSVGSILGLVAYVTGTMLSNDPTIPAPVIIAIAIGIGAALGAINGVLVAYGRVPGDRHHPRHARHLPGRLVELSGCEDRDHGQAAPMAARPAERPLVTIGAIDVRPWWSWPWSSPWSSSWASATCPTAGACLRSDRTRMRRGSPACRSSGTSSSPSSCPARWPASAASCSWCGSATSRSTAGQGLELQVVAAVVVGGVNIFGGAGSIIGAVLGAMLIDLLQQSLIRWLGVSEFVRDALLGLLILFAVASDKLILRPAADDLGTGATGEGTRRARGRSHQWRMS